MHRLEHAIGSQAATETIAAGTSFTIEEAARMARRSRGARKRPPTGWDSLTPAEHDVVELAVSGLTTPQIAARLFVGNAHMAAIMKFSPDSGVDLDDHVHRAVATLLAGEPRRAG